MHPNHARKGIGKELLPAIERELCTTDSFCIPRDHLFDFYGRAGFKVVDPKSAPSFLSDRLASYVEEDFPVAIMYRPEG